MPQVSVGDFRANFIPIWASAVAMLVELHAKAAGKAPAREEVEGLTWGLYQLGKTITAAQYQLCWASLQGLTGRVAAWQQPYDAWITPVLVR
jgi:amidase